VTKVDRSPKYCVQLRRVSKTDHVWCDTREV
jgi:hypothetical protein